MLTVAGGRAGYAETDIKKARPKGSAPLGSTMKDKLPTTDAERDAPPRPALNMPIMFVTFPSTSTVMFSGRSKVTR